MNIYKELMEGQYICRGDACYSVEGMRDMLQEMHFTREEIEILYRQHHGTAMNDLDRIRRDFTIFPDNIWKMGKRWPVRRLIYDLVKLHYMVKYFVIIQIILEVILFLEALFYKRWDLFIIITGFLSISYFAAYVIQAIRDDETKEDAEASVTSLEFCYKNKLSAFLKDRAKTVYKIENTRRMYKCMEEYLDQTDPSKKQKSPR